MSQDHICFRDVTESSMLKDRVSELEQTIAKQSYTLETIRTAVKQYLRNKTPENLAMLEAIAKGGITSW